MAKRDVKVELPVDDVKGTINLVERIIKRNTDLGANSPIQNDYPWPLVIAGAANFVTIQKEAGEADRQSQSLHYKALDILGSAAGQTLVTPKTLYQYITKVRDVLLVKNQSNPEALSEWGFNVVVSSIEGKRTVEVEIPIDSPENFIELCESVVEKQNILGLASPLNGKVDMADFIAKTIAAAADFAAAEEQRATKESKNNELKAELGYAAGQTSETPDTAYNFITNVRDLLLVAYQKNPKDLERWGYKVTITESLPGPDNVPPPPVV